MYIDLEEIIVRDMEPGDIDNLRRIVNQKSIIRFMCDWSDGSKVPGRMEGYLEWLNSQKDSTDVIENKRYAIALKETNELIGMVGMGLEENSNEVEVAYFMSEDYQRRGYIKRAVNALTKWCFEVSDIPYLILTIDIANQASCKVAEKCGFELFEKRTPIGHVQANMESDSFYYYRKRR